MKSQKLITKCLFFLAFLFLSIIFFIAIGSNGMNNAKSQAQRPLQTAAPRVDGGASAPPKPDAKTAPPPPAFWPREETDADSLTLLAIFQAHSPLASTVIRTEGHGAYRYRVGDMVPKGGVLAAILPTEVILYENGKQITLRMASMRGGEPVRTADAPTRNRDHPKMPWQVVDFLNKLDLTPVSEDSPDGYWVGEGFPESGTEEVGVKPGDTIVAVNGYPVGEYHSDYLVWLSFKDRYRASVLVRTEEGEEFSFHFPDDLKGVSLSSIPTSD